MVSYYNKLTRLQYKTLTEIIHDESGIVLNENKYNLLVARVSKRMRETGIASVQSYINLILKDKEEFDEFIDAITTKHTFFFRENKHCEFIINEIDNTRPLKIWCAASSSGEEPFSIAIQLLEYGFSFSIYASDISDSMLCLCRKAVYPIHKLRSVPLFILRKYFQMGRNKYQDYVKVKNNVLRYVTFGKYNLLSDKPFDSFDIIFCRNVMIYFDRKTRCNVVNTLCSALKPGGYFFIGMSENLHGFDHGLSLFMPGGYVKDT